MRRSFMQFLLCMACMTVLSACGSKETEDNGAALQPVQQLDCILVMPAETTVDRSNTIRYAEAEELESGAKFMDTLLVQQLSGNDNVRIVDGNQLETYFPEVVGGIAGVAKEVGAKLGCEGMLFTTVSRFKQRDGTSYAVDSPASAAFEMTLLDTRRTAVLWSTSFSETQETVLGNLFSWSKARSRGFKWITVEELVEQGMVERLEASPYF